MAKLIIRCDDIHPRMKWSTFNHFVDRLTDAGMTATLAVIPRCEDKDLLRDPPSESFWERMRQLVAEGWVIAQHGYTHQYDSRSPNYLDFPNRSEFAGHSLDTQLQRLRDGADILASEGLRPEVFIAPGHTFDRVTLQALEAVGLKYVSDGYGIWPYGEGKLTMVPQLLARPHGLAVGVYTTCFHLDELTISKIDDILAKLKGYEIVSLYEGAKLKKDGFRSDMSRAATKAFVKGFRKLRGR